MENELVLENEVQEVAKKPKSSHSRAFLIDNPWDGGKMTLREFAEREEKEAELGHTIAPTDVPKGGVLYLNYVRHGGVSYQFLLFLGKGYSDQALYFRRQKPSERFKLIADDCRIPEDYLFTVADAFERHGIPGARWSLGV